jgi:hypothetical protein
MIPAVALSAAWAVNYFRTGGGWKFSLASIVLVIAVIQAMSNQLSYYFKDDHNSILLSVYGSNPFPETKVLGDFIASRSKPQDKLLVLGSEPELLVYSKLESPLRHIYTYSLLSDDTTAVQFQNELLNALKARPRFVALTNIPFSWLYRETARNKKFWEAMSYEVNRSGKFRRIAACDLYSDNTVYHWDKEASDIRFKRSDQVFDIYERIE